MFEVIAEAVHGDYRCPVGLARTLSLEIMQRIERHGWHPHRHRLLGFVLGGIRSSVGEEVRSRLRQWTFEQGIFRSGVILATSGWQRTPQLVEILQSALNDEDGAVQRAAASSLSVLCAKDDQFADWLISYFRRGPSATARAAALECLCLGWPSHALLPDILAEAARSQSLEIVLIGLDARIRRREHNNDAFSLLCSLLVHNRDYSIGYEWRELIVSCLVNGWSGDPLLLVLCLGGIADHLPDATLDHGVVAEVLLRAFPGNHQVARTIARIFRDEQHPIFTHNRLDSLALIRDSFGDIEVIRKAIETWSVRGDHDVVDISMAAEICRTPVMKQRMIAELQTSTFAQWPASVLMDAWGLKDKEVRMALEAKAASSQAAAIAHLLPEILEPDVARRRLLELLHERPSYYLDRVFIGLSKIDAIAAEPNLVEDCLAALNFASPAMMGNERAFEQLIELFPTDPRVIDRVLGDLKADQVPSAVIAARLFRIDAVRDRVLDMLLPLPKALRITIIDYLDKATNEPFASELLARYVLERDAGVKTAASIAYHSKIAYEPEKQPLAIERLERQLEAVGYQSKEERHAAFAGLLVLHSLSESHLRNQLGTFRFDMYFKPNIPLLQLLAKEWTYLNELFGDQIGTLIVGNDQSLVNSMALVAADFPQVRQQMLHEFDYTRVDMSPQVLNFLAKTKARASELRDACIAVVKGNYDFDSIRTASRILADQFFEDPLALRTLLDGMAQTIYNFGLTIALTAAWPSCNILDKMYGQIKKKGFDGTGLAPKYVVLSRMPARDIGAYVQGLLPLIDLLYLSDLVTAVQNRLRWDTEARSEIAAFLTTTDSESMRASLPRILASVGAADHCRAWCELQASGPQSATLGFDMVAQHVRPLGLCLLDALSAS